MQCNDCQKENRSESKFCRFCGSKLEQKGGVSFSKIVSDIKALIVGYKIPVTNLIQSSDKKTVVIAVILIFGVSGTVFAAPKVGDYLEVNNLVKEAKQLESDGQYQEAFDILASTDEKWTLEYKRSEINELKTNETKFIEFKSSFESALGKIEESEFEEARTILQTIGSDFPEYSQITQQLTDVQVAIEGDLKEQVRLKEQAAQRAASARYVAEQKTKREVAARVQAEAEKASSDAAARVAAEQKQRADSQAATAAAAARSAEIEAEKAKEARAAEVRKSYRSQLTTIYNLLDTGLDDFQEGINYYNRDYTTLSISRFQVALSSFSSASTDAIGLNSRFSGLPSSYINAGKNMVTATSYALSAIDGAIDALGYGTVASLNYNHGQAISYANLVYNFLISN